MQRPGAGVLPQYHKKNLIVHPDNLKAGKLFDARRGFKVFTGAHNLGSHLGDDESKYVRIKYWKEKWERNIHTFRKTAGGVSQ